MEKLLKRKLVFKLTAILSLVFGVLSIAGIIGSILLLWYAPMVVCIIICANGFYGCPFYFIQYSNLKRCELILAEADETNVISELAERAAVTPEFAVRLIEQGLAKGYIAGYKLTENNMKLIKTINVR